MSNKFWAKAKKVVILKINRWSDTRVWSSGGGGYVDPHVGGRVRSAQVHSSVDQRCEVFHQDVQGKEDADDLGFTGLKFREKSNIFMLYGGEEGGKGCSFAYVENTDTGESWSNIPIKSVRSSEMVWLLMSVVISGLVWLMASSYSVQNTLPSIQEKIEVLQKEDHPSCHTSNRLDAKNHNGLLICGPGYYGFNNSPCKCLPKSEHADAIKNQYFEKLKEDKEKNSILILLISGIAGLFFGTIWFSLLNSSKKRKEKSRRKEYCDALIEASKDSGVLIEVANKEFSSLRRRASVS